MTQAPRGPVGVTAEAKRKEKNLRLSVAQVVSHLQMHRAPQTYRALKDSIDIDLASPENQDILSELDRHVRVRRLALDTIQYKVLHALLFQFFCLSFIFSFCLRYEQPVLDQIHSAEDIILFLRANPLGAWADEIEDAFLEAKEAIEVLFWLSLQYIFVLVVCACRISVAGVL